MGSGAFLVSACRYLSDRVVDAWLRDGLPDDIREDDRDELLRVARRLVADRCLFGVDRDPMAVELAKLSLWLVTLAKGRPFSFLDHALRCGDSLVGVIDVEQIKAFHLESGARQLSPEVSRALDVTETVLSEAAELRREIEAIPVHDIRSIDAKTAKLREAESLTDRLRLAADAVVGAALAAEGISDEEASDRTGEEKQGGKRGAAQFRDAKETAKERAYSDRLESVVGLVASALEDSGTEDGQEGGRSYAEEQARGVVDRWLTGERAAPVRPLHWPLEFPEIMGVGGASGFDAVIGNPPFIGGQKLTGALGTDYREYLVNRIGGGKRGSADLCAYFLLRNLALAPGRRTGIIATNTIAQGDTREVGLDQAVEGGWQVYRAIPSKPWPGTAAVVVSLLWLGGRVGDGEQPVLDGNDVRGITPGLGARSRVSGNPYRLVANAGQSFIGSYVLGTGFILSPEEAQELIEKDPRNAEVVFPYLNGEDLNSRPDCSASRWVINFHGWSEEKAATYEDVFAIVRRDVKPVRLTNNRKVYSDYWWQYAEKRPAMLQAIGSLSQVIAIARVSSTAAATFVPTRQVLHEKLTVFPSDAPARLALLNSTIHVAWAWKYSATLKTDLQYTPSDCYETFPLPNESPAMNQAGNDLYATRQNAMTNRNIGLTKLYGLLHAKAEQSADIEEVRRTLVEVDQAVIEAYGWTDIDLAHNFYQIRQKPHFTIAPSAQTEILDRLLELNHARYKEEEAAGLHAPGTKKKAAPKRKPKPKAEPKPEDGVQDGIF